MQDRQALAKKIKEGSQISKEIEKRNRKEGRALGDLDDELVHTYETFQSLYSNKLEEEKI